MDKNQFFGFLLIGGLLVAYMFYMKPSSQEIARQKWVRDSIEQLNALESEAQRTQESIQEDKINASVVKAESGFEGADSATLSLDMAEKYGSFYRNVQGKQESYFLENEDIKISISNLGALINSAELKKHKTYTKEALKIVQNDNHKWDLKFLDGNRLFQSSAYYFNATQGENKDKITFEIKDDDNRYLRIIYQLTDNNYLLNCSVETNMEDAMYRNGNNMEMSWSLQADTKEKNAETERNTSSIYYKYIDEEAEDLSETSYEKETLIGKAQWVSFKQQFFSCSIIKENGFEKGNAFVETQDISTIEGKNKGFIANLSLPFENGKSSFGFFFGPNNYKTLKSFKIGLEDQINLGWGIFGWVNEYFIINFFNILGKYVSSYGLIILIMTFVIKMILFPLTYKTYISSAKMRVLKPETDELNEKYKDEDPVKKQQAMMALYRKAGVNPLAGCVPMLFQMPILYAMFRFFPSSIELRQQAFLWADDLSSYDSIYDFPGGFEIPFYGDHISLFTILMSVSTFLYTKFGGNMTMASTSGPQAAQMKIMTYMMPVMFLFFFNSYSSGLSYYYFLSNAITMLQQFVARKWFIDEDKIHAQIQENKKKPKKKSGFQKRLEDMQKTQQNASKGGRKRK